jgi:transposase
MNARDCAHQIVRLFEFASTQPPTELSARAVARAFEVSHMVVTRAELRGYHDPSAHGRHRELSADCKQELVEWLANKAANHRAVNRTELLHECTERVGKSITRGCVDSLITRHAHELLKPKVFRKKI